jgi:hypothetical protein
MPVGCTSTLKGPACRADALSMSTLPPSLAELLDRAGDREDQRLLEQTPIVQPVEPVAFAGAGWQRGDDDVLPSGRGRHQKRFSLRRALGN